MPHMTPAERDAFLDTRGVLMRIGCVRPDGSPLVTPIWFIHRDGAIWFTPRARSEWFACLRADPRVSLSIDEASQPYRKVVVDGTAELVHDLGEDDVWRDLYREIARRYIADDAAEDYIERTIREPRGLYRVRLADARVRNWRMPVPGEPVEGIWHGRYYVEEGRGSRVAAGVTPTNKSHMPQVPGTKSY